MKFTKIKILYFAPCDFHTGVGGGARLKDMTNILARLGVKIQIISDVSDTSFFIKNENINENISLLSIHIPKKWPKLLKGFVIPIIILFGISKIKNKNMIFSHSPSIDAGLPGMLLSKIFKKPHIVDHMDVRDKDTPKFIFNNVLKNSSYVFSISKTLDNEIRSKYFKESKYLPIFTDTKRFKINKNERGILRNKFNLHSDHILIGYAGSFHYSEGLSILLKAIKNLKNEYTNIRLLVIGGKDSPEAEKIPELIREMCLDDIVILVPPIKHELIPNYLSACDILCAPKVDCEINRVANPAKVIEYLSMGIPSICSSIGGIIDMIEDGENGLLVKPGNVADLEDKIKFLILNKDIYLKISKNARETAKNSYSYEIIEREIFNILLPFFEKDSYITP